MSRNKEYNFDIVSFSGRKESGKTELANILVNAGYERKSFATSLKNLVCKLTGLNNINELNDKKNTPLGVEMNNEILHEFIEHTGFDLDVCRELCKNINKDSTGRDWLQIIGTDVIRKCDPDWHVKKTMESLEPCKKYVFDDTRFINELEALKNVGAECWFIIRTKTDNINNHESETILDYRMFDYNIIVNNSTLENLRRRWSEYVSNHHILYPYRKYMISKVFQFSKILPITSIVDSEYLDDIFVYKDFADIEELSRPDCEIVENDSHTGFIGADNPFTMEDWKRYY